MSQGFDKSEYQKEYLKDYRKDKKRVEFQLPLSEYCEFEKIAVKEGISPNSCIKNMALAYRQQKYMVPREVSDRLDRLSFLVRNIANNVNQVAHRSNTLNAMVEEHDLLMELKKLDDMVKDFTLNKLKDYDDY
tara:strand:- start:93 stop:491 length:399 start_codon:yes stop_codon:yes gene_type:complete